MKARNIRVTFSPQERKEYKALAKKIDREEKAEIIKEAREHFARQQLLMEAMMRLKAERERKGLSLAQMSEMTGITKANLSRLESASTNPTIDTLVRYAQALGVELKLEVAA